MERRKSDLFVSSVLHSPVLGQCALPEEGPLVGDSASHREGENPFVISHESSPGMGDLRIFLCGRGVEGNERAQVSLPG